MSRPAVHNLQLDADTFMQHAGFESAVKAYCHKLANLRESPRLLNAVLATDVRWRIVGYLLYLSSDTERFGSYGGATYSRLAHLCLQRQETSPRALKTLLGLLKLSSLIRLVPDDMDKRIQYYQPTARMDAFVRSWLAYPAAALDVLEPDGLRSLHLEDPAFLTRFNVSGGRAHLGDPVPLADQVPAPMAAIQPMLGAYSVMVGIMETDLDGRPPPSISRLAGRFGLSRGQVRNVLAAGCEAGLFTAGNMPGAEATPLLRETFKRWIAIELAFYARHMRPPGQPLPPVTDTFF